MFKITLQIDYNGPRYGIEFFRGVGTTDNERIANTLKAKGLRVERIPEADDETADLDKLTVAELVKLAEEKKVDLGGATKKADIIAAIEAAKPPESNME